MSRGDIRSPEPDPERAILNRNKEIGPCLVRIQTREPVDRIIASYQGNEDCTGDVGDHENILGDDVNRVKEEHEKLHWQSKAKHDGKDNLKDSDEIHGE